MHTRATRKPKKMAAVMPPAAAVEPPVRAPMRPLSATAFLTPLASRWPKPVRGTVAPAPPQSTRYWYTPAPLRITPAVT